MGKKNLDKELEDYADRLSEELRIEEKTKDDNQLTSEGKKLWSALRLSKQLHWKGNYCYPNVPTDNEKAQILKKVINNLHYDNKNLFKESDFNEISGRLIRSLNRLNADLGIDPYFPKSLDNKIEFIEGENCILWLGEKDKLLLLANLLFEQKYILKSDEWLEHFDNNALEKIKTEPIDWQKNTYELQHLLRRLKAIDLINYPSSFEKHFTVNGQPLKDLGGGMHEYNKLDKIDAILDQIR
tara:strand:+ start:451 stop:1173 length:723 start_codon:yes stop_codon:yes gene_type:complete